MTGQLTVGELWMLTEKRMRAARADRLKGWPLDTVDRRHPHGRLLCDPAVEGTYRGARRDRKCYWCGRRWKVCRCNRGRR